MLSDLMRAGGYCVNYLNMRSRGLPAAFGFYVCDELQAGAAYSKQAKHCVYHGLCVIQAKLGWDNLVGIYVDVIKEEKRSRLAFQQLKVDVDAGYFRRVLVVRGQDLFGEQVICQELEKLSQEVDGFELIQLKENHLPGGDLFSAREPVYME